MEDFVTFEMAKKLKEKGFNNCVTAPTISQVLKWLREEKNYYVTIDLYWSDNYGYIVYLMSPYECQESESNYKTYEQAAIAGIEYVLDNLI